VWVLIRHKVGSLSFESGYAHMERGSVELKVGDTVKVADYVGRVGNTGTSTGAHLHLEIRVDGQQVDPFAWLKKNAK
jgi:murein DD-endopeptidase MepM/ murein hydrolase activator NlpD